MKLREILIEKGMKLPQEPATKAAKIVKAERQDQASLQKMSDYDAKKKALQDIQMDPNTSKDPELKKELARRKQQLDTTKESSNSEVDAIKQLASLVSGARVAQEKPVSDFAAEMKALAGIKTETATAGATSAGNIASVANPKQAYGQRPKDSKGLPKAPQKKNADGTAKNALDIDNNLMGGATVKR